jgi:hypothetical protein
VAALGKRMRGCRAEKVAALMKWRSTRQLSGGGGARVDEGGDRAEETAKRSQDLLPSLRSGEVRAVFNRLFSADQIHHYSNQ